MTSPTYSRFASGGYVFPDLVYCWKNKTIEEMDRQEIIEFLRWALYAWDADKEVKRGGEYNWVSPPSFTEGEHVDHPTRVYSIIGKEAAK